MYNDTHYLQGVETYCDGRQGGARCYGALGGTVVLHLMDSTSEIYRYLWSSNSGALVFGTKKHIVFNRIEHIIIYYNGTFRINNLSRTDGGEYTLETFDSNGLQSNQQTLQLTIQAPVSSVLLVSECLSLGQMRVSCSSEGGDSPQYSWTLDGCTLTDVQLLSGNKDSKKITLGQGISGKLVCSVSNHISNVSKEEMISTCDRFLLIMRAAVILILTGIFVYFALKKKQQMSEGPAVRRKMEH
ncbi:hepatic and glial cell adhesion molecule-like [Symphorus nematophorus]